MGGILMGEFDEKVARLREDRVTCVSALSDLELGGRVIRDGADVTEKRRRHLQGVLQNLDALIVAYEDANAES
jgi:hypothetical protein